MSPNYKADILNFDYHSIPGWLNTVRAQASNGFIIHIRTHMRQDGPPLPNAFDPFKGQTEPAVRRMPVHPEAVDDPYIDPLQAIERPVIESNAICRIGKITNSETERSGISVVLIKGCHRQTRDIKLPWLYPVSLQTGFVEWPVTELFFEDISESLTNLVQRDLIRIDIEPSVRCHVDPAQFVDAMNMIRMGMGEQNSIKMGMVNAEKLFPQIRTRIDQQTLARDFNQDR